MSTPRMTILYVADAAASSAFYAQLLERAPTEASPGFAMFALDSGFLLGLWGRAGVAPAAGAAGGSELAIAVADRAAVERCHGDWKQRGIPIAQVPTAMDFGYTFVGLDPDGHRLRVFAPAAA